MKRILLSLLAVGLAGVHGMIADDHVQAAQTRLKEAGFYFGEINGVLDANTSAALSRYQIRNGLQISGQLDDETAKSLGLPAAQAQPSPTTTDSDSWRRLRKTDQQFLERLESTKQSRKAGQTTPGLRNAPPSAVPQPTAAKTAPQTSPPPDAPSTTTMPATSTPGESGYGSMLVLSRERLRDYVGAFVLAGLDQRVGAELEFFGDRVEYYDQGVIGREKIRADLQRYNQRWPERRFWLAGEVEVEPQADSRLRVTFPLRYELQNRGKRSSGQIRKTLLLEVVGEDLQIAAVNERKMK